MNADFRNMLEGLSLRVFTKKSKAGTTTILQVTTSLKNRGFVETVTLIKKNLVYQIQWYLDRTFDRRFGTDTSGQIQLDSLKIESHNRQHGIYYEATPTKLFSSVMKNYLDVRYEDFIFIDLGSGKGRPLLLASDFPFKEIIGIEFSDSLHQVAQSNIAIYKSKIQKCFTIKSLCMDATEYQFPMENLVLFFYHPFREPVLSYVLDKLKQSIKEKHRKIIIIYCNPLLSHHIEQLGFLTQRKEIQLPFDFTRKLQRKFAVYSN